MTLYHRAADMLERYGRVNGVMHCEVSMLIAELRAAAALDELVRENERLGLYDDQKPNAHELPAMPQAFADYMTKQMPPDTVISDPQWWARRIWRTAMRLHAAPAPAQPRQPLSEWRDQVEQRLLTWRQRTVNRSGDQLALDDFMDKESLDDLIDFVCDEWAGPVGRLALTNAQVDAHLDAILKASGSALRHYSMSGTREAMRSAVRAIERAITGDKP